MKVQGLLQSRKAALMVAAVMSLGAVSAASAQVTGNNVTISGATLFADYFKMSASTNDYIDVDGDGNALSTNGTLDQLAKNPTITTGPYNVSTPSSNVWLVTQRGVGSGNGLAEMVNSQLARINGASVVPTSVPSEGATFNRAEYYTNKGVATTYTNPDIAGGYPVAISTVDIAVMDVPTTWFVKNGSSSASRWSSSPNTSGYGQNTLTAVTGQSNGLKSLSNSSRPTDGSLNTNTASANNRTIYDTTIAWVPVAVIANAGTGISAGNIDMSSLQFLNVTGRMASGENLVAVTRDSGSGTRNAMANSIGVDPTYAMGDNYGQKADVEAQDLVGADFIASNKGGSSRMEGVVQNSRLAVGYTGLDGASRAAEDATGGKYEILNVRKDIAGGTAYVRPSATTVMQNADINTGYQLGGAETFATVGDPLAAYDFNGDGDTTDAGEAAFAGHAGNQTMDNKDAALYIRNLVASINGFVSQVDDPANEGSPAQALVTKFTLMAAISATPVDNDPTTFVANADYNANVQSVSLSSSTLNVPGFGTVNSGNGKVSTRTAAVNYSDGNTINNSYYVCIDGDLHLVEGVEKATTLSYGSNNNSRNKIAGDFDGNGARNTADVANMMATMKYRLTGSSSDRALILNRDGYSPELVGDFNSDGNFDAKDVRYWADGLHLVNGKLDRKAGFTAVDNAWTVTVGTRTAGNFFATTLATGKAYVAGDSRGDVAGASTLGAGSVNSGADGVINAADIDYVMSMRNVGSWANLLTNAETDPTKLILTLTNGTKARADLSADINGDLVLSQADVDELVTGVLGTKYGDFNLDRHVDQADFNVLVGNWGAISGKTWATGDLNGDGKVDQSDFNTMVANWAFAPSAEVLMAQLPEPTSMALLAIGGMMLAARRRQA